MLRYFGFIIIAGAAFGFVFYQLAKFLLTTSGFKSKMQRDLKALQEDLHSTIDELVPWDFDEFKLMSYETEITKKAKGLQSAITGFILDIYHERMLSFTVKKYGSKGKILAFRTKLKPYTIQIIKDNKYIIKQGDNLIFEMTRSGQMLLDDNLVGHYNIDQQLNKSITWKSNEIANIQELDGIHKTNVRVFNEFRAMSDKDEDILLPLAVLQVCKEANYI